MELDRKRIVYDCPLCDTEHEIDVKVEKSIALIKGKKVEYDKIVYYCNEEDDEFCPSKIMDKNLLRARDAYRENEGLLTSREIKNIREVYKLNQKEFSNLLGWGDVTIQRYETKTIQDLTYDSIMRMTLENPTYCLDMLEKNKDKFLENRYEQIKESIKDIIRNKGNTHLIIEEIRNLYIDFDKECELNGFKTLDISKVNSVIGYFSNYVPQLYKVKLMNLLWYVDFVFHKLYNKSMTGLVYKHRQMGAVPIAHNKLLELPSIKVKEEMNYDYIRHIISPIREISINEFSLEELGVLQKVVSFFKELETKEIIEYVYCEKAYKETEIDEVMSYKYSKELVGF